MSSINPNTQEVISPLLRLALASPTKEASSLTPLNDAEFDRLKISALSRIREECDVNPYHNSQHIELVLKTIDTIIQNLSEKISQREATLLRLAALYHDFGHPGKTIRSTVNRDIPRKDLSNEEYAALIADQDLQNHLTAKERLDLQGLILATTFGQAEKPYKPTTKLERLLAFADIGNFIEGFDAWLINNRDVIKETDPEKRPKNMIEFIKTRLAFIKHVEEKLVDIKEFLDPRFFDQLRSMLVPIKTQLADVHLMKTKYQGLFAGVLAEAPAISPAA